MPWTTPQRLTWTTQRQSSRVWSAIWLKVETPALLHSTSTRPNRSIVAAASRVDRRPRRRRRPRTASASPPASTDAAATAAASSPSRSATTTAEPSAANRSASARPMPLAAAGHHRHPRPGPTTVGRHQPPSSTISSPFR